MPIGVENKAYVYERNTRPRNVASLFPFESARARPLQKKSSAGEKSLLGIHRDGLISRRLEPATCYGATLFTAAKLMNRSTKHFDYADVHSQISTVMNFHRIRGGEGTMGDLGIYRGSDYALFFPRI